MGASQKPEWDKLRAHWYKQTYILLEIAKQMKYKELCFIEKKPKSEERKPKVMRCGQGFTIDLINTHFKAFSFLKYPHYNMYFSLMGFKNMPTFSFAPSVRKKQYKEWTGGKYREHYAGFDLGWDLDSQYISNAQKDTLKLTSLLDKYNIPFSCKFSGSKGFHLLVRHKWLPQLPREKLVPMLAKLTTMVKHIDNIKSLDDSIIDERRVFKCPYSFDRGLICLPLTDRQLEDFSLEMVKPQNILNEDSEHYIKIKERGMLERNADQPEEKARTHFLDMASNFIEADKYA